MNLPPIIAALRKHKAGVFLIGLQIALTLAIACNLISIVGQRVQRIDRPTGLIENNLFMISQKYVDAPKGNSPSAIDKLDSMQLTDLAALRRLPDVQYATPVDTLPLSRNVDEGGVALKPDQKHATASVYLFLGGEQVLPTLGLQLVAGRDFNNLDIHHHGAGGKHSPAVVIVTRALADKLFPHGDAVGKPVYFNGSASPSTIIGVVKQLLTPRADGSEATAYDSLLIPVRLDGAETMYAVRAKPGRMQAAMREAKQALFKVNPLRVIPQGGRYLPEGIRTFAQVRAWGYALDDFMVRILVTICVILLLITGIGMAGLTSFWVRQRYKQIGIRRALGATRANILHYFQLENLIIAGGGCIVGAVLAVGIDLLILRMFQTAHRMPLWYIAVGIVAILLLGQIAVFMPARRASDVPPVVATRSV